MMQKQSNMTFEVTILYCGTATPPPAPSISAKHVHGLLIFHSYKAPKSRQIVRHTKHNQYVIDIDLRD